MFDYTPMILKFWVQHSLKSPKALFLLIIIEYFSIWAECLNTISRLLRVFQGNGRLDADDLDLSKLNVLNPLYYLQKVVLGENTKISQCSSTTCSIDNTILLVILLGLMGLMFVHHLWGYLGYHNLMKKNISQSSEAKNAKFSDLLNFLLINALDIVFKILSVFLYYIFFNKIFVAFFFNTDIIYGILSIIFILLFTFFSYFSIKYVLLFMRLDSNDSLHYDNFSKNYDSLFLVIKIIISINKNLLLINNDTSTIRLIVSLDYLLLFCIFNFMIKSIINITNDKNLSLVANLNLNLLRLFNVLYISIYVIIHIFFHLLSIYQIILTIFASILISIALMIYLYNKIHTLIYGDEKIIFQLTYLLSLFLKGESASQAFEMESIKIKSFHALKCLKKEKDLKCSLCQLEDLKIIQDVNDPEKINLLNLMFKFIEENILYNFSQDENDFFTFMHLIYNFNLTLVDSSIPQYKFIYQAKYLIKTNKERKNNFYFNLVFYYSKINHQTESDLKKFTIVKNYDSSLVSLRKSIDIVKEIVDTIESRVKKDLYPQTNQLNNLKLLIMKNLEDIHEDKNFYNDSFSFVMTKFIFEKTFNVEANSISKVLPDSEDFDSRHDMIGDHFKKDNFIYIRYEVTSNSLIITRASKNFTTYQGKYFEEIFPRQYRELGKSKFINEILTNNEKFTFEFLQDTPKINSLDFIQSIKLECKIFRSPDLQEIFIFTNFEFLKDDLLVFETPLMFDTKTNNFNPDLNKSFLITFSEKLQQTFLVDPKFLENLQGLKIPKKTLLFYDVFRKITLMGSSNKFNQQNQSDMSNNSPESNGTDFVLNYRSYYLNFFEELEKNIHAIDNTESITQRLEEAKTLRDANITLNIRLTLKYMFKKSESSDIYVFSFKNFTPKKMIRGLQEDNLLDGLGKENKKNQLDESFIKNNIENYNKSSSVSVSSSASGGGLKDGILSTLVINGKKSSSLLTSDSKMAGFTISTLIINISLGLYCLFFLFMGLSSNTQMQELNLLKINFNSFERMFYQTALSQFYNVGVYKKGTSDMSDYILNNYWDKFASAGLTINMGDYANSELYVKTDFLKEKMGLLQDFIYSSSFKDVLDPIFSFRVDYKALSAESSDIKLMTLNPTFFETILMFMNNAKASVFYTTNTMIYIHNYDLHTGNYDFSTIYDKNITNVQKAVYEAIFNFPVFLNNLNKIWGQVQDLYYSNVDSIFNLNLYLSLTLIGLHVFLLFVSVGIINFLKKITTESNLIYSKIIQGDWSNYLSIKLLLLKDMINFYKIDPIKSSTRMRKELRETAKLTKEKQNNDEKMFEHADKTFQTKSEDAQITIENLISPLSKVLFYLFTSYLIYACSFIFIFSSSQSDIILTSQFSSHYLQVDKGIMNSILLLQCILFSNQTDYSLNQYMKNYTTFISDPYQTHGYIWNLLEDSKLDKKYLTQLEKNYQKYEEIEHQANEASYCDHLYSGIEDDVFSITKKLYPGDSLIKNLIILCHQYPVTGEKYYKNIIEEINYIGAKMIRNYNHSYGDYTKMKATNDETEFFDEFTIAVMIIRPIQTYILNTHIGEMIKSTEENFVLFIIIFMIGNILMECLIFFVINRKLIRRVLVINDEIRCLTLCLTA
jgi:hypothetical protein